MFRSTERLVHAHIDAAGLPAGLARLVRDVVRRTRLRRTEQLDVAAELVSHFAEGLAAGRSADELVAAFGSTTASARSLRRAAIGKRHPVDRSASIVLRGGAWAGGAAVALYVAAAVGLHFRGPRISFDALAALNDSLPKAGVEGPAIDLYVDALADTDGRSRLESLRPTIERLESRAWIYGSDLAARDEARESLAALGREIEALRSVAGRPALGMPLSTEAGRDPRLERFFHLDTWRPAGPGDAEAAYDADPFEGAVAGVLLPQVTMIHRTARLLAVDAGLAAIDGRTGEFLADVEAILAMARHAGEARVIVATLVECAIHRIALATVVSAIENEGARFSDAELARLDALVRASAPDVARGIEGETLMVRDFVQRIYTDDGDGDGVADLRRLRALERTRSTRAPARGWSDALFEFVAGPLVAASMADRRDVVDAAMRRLGSISAACAAPTRAESAAILDALEEEPARPVELGADLASMLLPAIETVPTHRWAAESTIDATLAAIGIERFQRAQGRLPRDLAELSASVGRELGRWSHPSTPWNYAIVDGRPLICDAGLDGIDDRARLPRADVDPDLDAGSAPLRALGDLDACAADSVRAIGGAAGFTLRAGPLLSPDAPLDPDARLSDAWEGAFASNARPASLLRSDGDCVRVLWRSRTAGPFRIAPVRAAVPTTVGPAGVDAGQAATAPQSGGTSTR